jgi:hypothetical protein
MVFKPQMPSGVSSSSQQWPSQRQGGQGSFQLQAAMKHQMDIQELDPMDEQNCGLNPHGQAQGTKNYQRQAQQHDGDVHGAGHDNRRTADYSRDEYEDRNYEYERGEQTHQTHVVPTSNFPQLTAEGPYDAQPERAHAMRG